MYRLWVSLLSVVLFVLPVNASEWRVDEVASTLEFEFVQEGESYVGAFKRFSADIIFDPDNLSNAKVDVVIDLSSVAAGTAERNDALISGEFFAVKSFPKAEFKSQAFRQVEGSRYEVDAELSIRGIVKTFTMPFTLVIEGDKAHMKGRLSLNRLDYKLGEGFWADKDFIGHEVVVLVDLTVSRAP